MSSVYDDGAAAGAEGARARHRQRPDTPLRRFVTGKKPDGTPLGGPAGIAREIISIVVIALLLSFLIKTFLFRAYFIPSQSMENTLQIDDRIFVNLLVPRPFELHRGDVIVFKDSNDWLAGQALPHAEPGPIGQLMTFVGLAPDQSQQHLVKRVIGMPGDTVECCDSQGRIMVNGQPIDEPYLYPGAAPSDVTFNETVPEGKLWVMGDHRNNSADSRAHIPSESQPDANPFIDISDVEGTATVTAWPLNRIRILPNDQDVFDDVPAPAGE